MFSIALKIPTQVVSAKLKDGWYGSSLIKKDSDSSSPYIKKVKIDGKKITTYGNT